MTRWTALFLAMGFAAGCRTTGPGSHRLSETEVRNFESELGMKPGVGFESILEDARGSCVDFDGVQPSGASQEAVYALRLVENHSQLAAEFQLSAGSQVKAAITDEAIQASAKTKFVMGNAFSINRYSVFILVSARIKNETSHLSNVRMKGDATALLAPDAAAGLPQFRARCGDEFLTGFTTGGEFHALIEIATSTDEMRASLVNKYQRETGSTGGRGSTISAIEGGINAMTAGQNLRIWTYQRGGAGSDQVGIVTTVSDLMQRIKNLADTVRDSANPRPLTATFTDYFTLLPTLPVSYRHQLMQAKDVVRQMSATQGELLDLAGNLDYITIHPEAFVGVNAAKLREIQTARKAVDENIRLIRDTGRACALNLAACRMPAALQVPAVSLPRRKPSLASLSSEKVRVRTDLTWIDTDALYDGWFNPPECYLTIEAGKGDDEAIVIRRTATDNDNGRCQNLDDDIEVPVALIKDTFDTLGVGVDRGWLQVKLWEDDPSYDDFLGSTWVYFRDLEAGAKLKAISRDHLTMEVGFELKYE